MNNTLVAIVGEDSDVEEILFKGLKIFYPQSIVLLTKQKYLKKSKNIEKNLEKFDIKIKIIEVSNFLQLEEVFMKISDVSNLYKDNNLVINVDTDYMSSCLALSSAFVSGIQAIGVLGEEIIAYPVMKFSYYNAINDKKMDLLKILNKKGEVKSMEELSKISKMSLPLIAYHLKGNRDSKGLVEMNLVNTKKSDSSVCVSLTELGKLIVNGYVDVNKK